ncbi:hypothetical protein CKM354_000518900 [Cercospora kikuchii]|uniref:C2H2-type domain-containing protein n=1 Tax=Cercospora kikuchii TaxID=84275 RepID=A0A9P3CCV3_9PEZI|nr:uncharacterized protein CKM354_000518900 [Cercospora kikuchii]GIZ41904.1 hypothetical protein CKM354_000518900 [Cercospora kikuchii]
MPFLYGDDCDGSQGYFEAEGLGKIEPMLIGQAKEVDNDDMDDSTAKEVGPGDNDPGLESLGLGPGRLASEPPSALLQEDRGEKSSALVRGVSGETSRTATPGLDDVPALSHSPRSITMEETTLEEPQMSMAYDDQAAALHGRYESEHTLKQAERRAFEGRPVTPDTPGVSARSLSLRNSVASPYAEHEMNTRATGSDRSPVILGSSPASPSNVIVREPITTSAQHRMPKTPKGQRESPKARNGGRRAKSGLKSYKCPFPDCDKQPFKSKFELDSHQNSHKTTGDFPCRKPVCNKRFRRLSDRNRHEERSVQHGGKGIRCPYCSDTEQKLARIDNLKKHITRHHGIDKLAEYSRVDKTRPRPPQQTDFEFIAFRPKS